MPQIHICLCSFCINFVLLPIVVGFPAEADRVMHKFLYFILIHSFGVGVRMASKPLLQGAVPQHAIYKKVMWSLFLFCVFLFILPLFHRDPLNVADLSQSSNRKCCSGGDPALSLNAREAKLAVSVCLLGALSASCIIWKASSCLRLFSSSPG